MEGSKKNAKTFPYQHHTDWGMLIETGIWPIHWLIKYKRMMLYHELKYTETERLAKKMMEEQEKYKMNGLNKEAKKNMAEIGIKDQRMAKSEWKRLLKGKIEKKIQEEARKKYKT